MKALLALIIVYVGTFFLVIQGGAQNAVQAASQSAGASQDRAATAPTDPTIDPAKEADIRALMELVVLNIGLDLGFIPQKVFTMLVIMALATTLSTAPLLRLLARRGGVPLVVAVEA